MEKFKQKLKKDIVIGIIYCSLMIIIASLLWFVIPDMPNAFTRQEGRPFIFGFFVGNITVVISNMVRKGLALRSENELKKLYIQEIDERLKVIEAQSGKAAIKTVLSGLSLAMIVVAKIDRTICLTLFASVLFIIIVMIITHLLYSKKL